MENSFNQNRVWGWGELALQYFPNISQKSATMQLLKWVRVSDKLVDQLEASGWHPRKKFLTPRQKTISSITWASPGGGGYSITGRSSSPPPPSLPPVVSDGSGIFSKE